jgi:LPS-assembly protein
VAKVLGTDGKPSYREFLRLKLAQTYDIKEATRDVSATGGAPRIPFSNVGLEVDFLPFQYLSFLARNQYSIYDATLTQSNYDMTLRDSRGDSVTLAYRYTQNAIEEINLALKAVITKNTDLSYYQAQDQLNKRDLEKTYVLTYHKQCWSVGFSYSEKVNATAIGDQYDKTYMIIFSLLGLGSFSK